MIRRFYVTVNGRGYEVEIEEVAAFPRPVGLALEFAPQPGPRLAAAPAAIAAASPPVAEQKPAVPPAEAAAAAAPAQPSQPKPVELPAGGVAVRAPMPGKILAVKVSVGQSVHRGDVLMILEAMKMENEIQSPTDGMVSAIAVEPGQTVEAGAPLASIG